MVAPLSSVEKGTWSHNYLFFCQGSSIKLKSTESKGFCNVFDQYQSTVSIDIPYLNPPISLDYQADLDLYFGMDYA